MRILITGATGLVGRAITTLCLEKGYQVNYLTTSKKKLRNAEAYRGYYWDPATSTIDTACFQDVDIVINLAGAPIAKRWTSAYKKEILRSRVNALQTLYKGLKETAVLPTRLLSASAIGVYPDSPRNYYHEDEEASANSFLGEVVVEWEKAADQFKSLGIQVTKIRIGLVLSMQGGALPAMVQPVKMYAGAAFGSGEQWQSWIHVEDLAALFLHLAEEELDGVYNGVSPNPVPQKKLLQEIARILDRPMWMPAIPAGVLRLLLGQMSAVLLESQRVSAKKTEASGFVFSYCNLRPALEDLLMSHKKSRLPEEPA